MDQRHSRTLRQVALFENARRPSHYRRFGELWLMDRRPPEKITVKQHERIVHIELKEIGRIPEGGGWRVHCKGSDSAKAASRSKTRGSRTGYVFRHSAIDGYSRLAVLAEEFLCARTSWPPRASLQRLRR